MVFYIIEIKARDLYVIYDAQNQGVCCCSLYTIKQLTDMGHSVIGYDPTRPRNCVFEVDLNGKPRQKKAPIACEDETKRSAVTIARGLDEKHYPRIKQSRQGYMGTVNPGDKVNFTITRTPVQGIVLNDYSVVCLHGQHEILTPECIKAEKRNFTVAPVSAVERPCVQQVQQEYSKLQQLRVRKAELEAEIKRMQTEISEQGTKAKAAMQEYKIAAAVNGVTGKEICGYSNIMKHDGNVPLITMLAIIRKTTRPLYYTFGLEYRNPKTHNKPVSKTEAEKLIRNGGFTEVSAYEDGIYINQYHENDMF